MIGETASRGERRLEGELDHGPLATQLPQNFPRIKALVWFNWRIYQQALNWWPFQIESSSSAQTAFKNGSPPPTTQPGGGFGSLPLRSKIQPPSTTSMTGTHPGGSGLLSAVDRCTALGAGG